MRADQTNRPPLRLFDADGLARFEQARRAAAPTSTETAPRTHATAHACARSRRVDFFPAGYRVLRASSRLRLTNYSFFRPWCGRCVTISLLCSARRAQRTCRVRMLKTPNFVIFVSSAGKTFYSKLGRPQIFRMPSPSPAPCRRSRRGEFPSTPWRYSARLVHAPAQHIFPTRR